MAATMEELPLTRTVAPSEGAELAALIAEAHGSKTPVYPIGGGTSLGYGVPAKMPGIGLSTAKLTRTIDYPARDMTITVEAGMTMRALQTQLAAERQTLPIDVPQSDRATLGGVIAANWNGPRRFGLGTLRDYVIGISAVDGTGRIFKGGGRVVKNVAGYDFCKLLTGSFGSLAVISQVTLKVRPIPESSVLLATRLVDFAAAERLSAAIGSSLVTPVGWELIGGPEWESCEVLGNSQPHSGGPTLLALLEGSKQETDFMLAELSRQWREAGAAPQEVECRDEVRERLVEWSAEGSSPLVIKATMRPSGLASFLTQVREIDPQCSYQAHAGNGIAIVKFREFPPTGLSRMLVGQLQPAAAAFGGHVSILSNPSRAEATRQSVWGGNDGTLELMRSVKAQFDPSGILNPGRFIV